MSKESLPTLGPGKDASYPEFEEGPDRHIPEIVQPKPQQEDERPKPPVDQDPADLIY